MFDAAKTIDIIINNIRSWFETNGNGTSAVIGISGGKDSTIAAALLARALGPDRVVGVMMPNGVQRDISDSERVIKALGIKDMTVNIADSYAAMNKDVAEGGISVSEDALVNLQPRLRMCTLYMVAQSLPNGGRVINTCNRSEDFVGYATKYGDCAGDISILGNLFVSEILAIGDLLPEIPNDLVHKAPSDGLWGDTDEDRFGFTYDQLEAFVMNGTCGNAAVDTKILRMHRTSRHKYAEMYVCTDPTEN